jgi:hypothetical protein
MAEHTHNTDMSEEPDRKQLEDRIDKLEQTVAKMLPGRRDALKMGGAALAGGSLMAGSASAQNSGQVGTIGTDNDRVDVNAEDISAVLTNTERLGNGRLFAGAFDGVDADSRLDNCLSASSRGDLIYLEKAAYPANRTINADVGFVGQGIRFGASTRLTGNWTITEPEVIISRLRLQASTITIQNNDCLLTQLREGSVLFESGTANCVIDSSVNTNVTDNGSNTIGDIS